MFLEQIVAEKRRQLEEARAQRSLENLQALIQRQPPPHDFPAALVGKGVRLIAEIKKASPSRGLLCPNFDHLALARTYAENGAAAISVLTESRYFQGSLEHLADIRQAQARGEVKSIPLLRKDFIFDPYQIYEARAFGADALLLIAAILDSRELQALLHLSHRLGMSCLVETHNLEEVDKALAIGAGVIGINNRDLKTFAVDLSTTERLRPHIPPGHMVVSESGIKSRADIQRLAGCGINAVLVGETLVTAPDIAAKVRELA